MISDPRPLWRVLTAGGLILVVGVPLGLPFGQLVVTPEGWRAWQETGRLVSLAINTLALAAGAVALALPAGTATAILLYRTDLPLRRLLRGIVVLLLFIPLPLVASAWQAALGAGGWFPIGIWTTPGPANPTSAPVWTPWARGLWAAVWVHAVAGLPWVVWIVGQGLRWVERDLEEDALTAASAGPVLWHVTLVRCRGFLWAAALWVALQTATEITVTDVMQVGTFAEEVYTQLVVGDEAAVVRSVALAVPVVLLLWAVLLWTIRRLERRLPPLESFSAAPLEFRIRWLPRAYPVFMLGGLTLLGLVPLGSLVWKVGLEGNPSAWSAQAASHHFLAVLKLRGWMVAANVGVALSVGVLAASVGLVVSWLADRSRWFTGLLAALIALSWALPAPLAGFGLKQTIIGIIDQTGSGTLATLLYYGPSFVPVIWADFIRLLPFALALLWPAVRLIPAELREGAWVDGARPWQEFRYVVVPLVLPVAVQAALAVAVLALGELGAEKLVETPGAQTLAHELFNQMHYGVTNDLAALCLVLVVLIALGAATLHLGGRFLSKYRALFPGR